MLTLQNETASPLNESLLSERIFAHFERRVVKISLEGLRKITKK
jgi:hypothetical protein